MYTHQSGWLSSSPGINCLTNAKKHPVQVCTCTVTELLFASFIRVYSAITVVFHRNYIAPFPYNLFGAVAPDFLFIDDNACPHKTTEVSDTL